MWWIYFNIGAERASRRISQSGDPGRMARLAYTYIQLPIVAGIIVSAVGDEILLAHPLEQADLKSGLTMIGGPVLYIVGNLLFKRTTAHRFALSHLCGLGLFFLLSLAVTSLTMIQLAAAAALILVVIAVWETVSLTPKRPVPSEDKEVLVE
jgi:low temperature requirement protein LtrA